MVSKGGEIMNNYEQSRIVEVGRASDVILGMKMLVMWFIDSLALINAMDIYIEDIDETDD